MLAEDQSQTVCPICHVIDTQAEFPEPRGVARRIPVARCRRCGLVFHERARTTDELDEAQRTAYGMPHQRFGPRMERLIHMFRLARVRLAQRHMPAGGRVLDVGCGRGLYLRLLRDRGYQVRGTELSATTAKHADPDIPIDVGELEPGQYPEGSFDLITIWHVLEHLRSPDRALAACSNALEPGGALLIAVPNYASFQARLGGESWFHLDLERHIFQFTPQTLERLLAAHGFRIERLQTGQWEMDPFGLLQTTLNRLGLRHNALYDTLRNNEDDKADLSKLYRLAMLITLPIGMGIAIPVSLVLRALRRAGSLIVVARKI